MTTNKKRLAYLAGILSSSIFGLSFLFSKIALENSNSDVFFLICSRFTLGSIILILLIKLRLLKSELNLTILKKTLKISIFYPTGYFILELFGINLTSSSQAGIIIGLFPIFIPIIGYIFEKENYKNIKILPILFSILGIIIINIEELSSFKINMGNLLLIVAVIFGSYYNVKVKKVMENMDSVSLTCGTIINTAICFNIILFIRQSLNGSFSEYLYYGNFKYLGSVLFLGILSTVLAFLFMNYTLKHLSPVIMGILYNLTTLISAIAGIIILKEVLSFIQIIGLFVILLSVFLSCYEKREGVKAEVQRSV
ncbi:MAG: DMT family transporter [Cetobacterium sp.]|uniref:DMT family transporter n=1 Tax=unclassified Cetobacterium TaxID=2630983 RepID=UPI00163CF114|nr:DMT family transporter [Cetobacterium sp. 2A]MBC2856881.1 DMT family transporter [Cetobacterium sp. 2A]